MPSGKYGIGPNTDPSGRLAGVREFADPKGRCARTCAMADHVPDTVSVRVAVQEYGSMEEEEVLEVGGRRDSSLPLEGGPPSRRSSIDEQHYDAVSSPKSSSIPSS